MIYARQSKRKNESVTEKKRKKARAHVMENL